VLDLLCSTVLYKIKGVSFERLLQFIASGALGESSFKGGKGSAALGLLFHFSIAFTAAAVYYAASRHFAALTSYPFAYGMLYCGLVHFFMALVVVPLSRTPKTPFTMGAFLQQLVIHMLAVGPSISLVIKHFS
jgi:uncharacterized membrane protein YagU involved in acid resistance